MPDASSWGGLQPVYVAPYAQFALDGDFTHRVLPAYRELLVKLGLDPDLALDFRFLGYTQHDCLNPRCGVESVYLPVVNCGRLHPHTSFKHVGRCVARILDQVEFLERHTPVDYAICIDLTTPAWVSKRLPEHRILKRFERSVTDFLHLLRGALFRDHRSALGGVYSVHVWKTTKPLDPHLHTHLLLYNVAYDSGGRTFYRFRPWLSLTVVRECWRRALRKNGLWDEPTGKVRPDLRLSYIKLEKRPRLIHRIRYQFRKPIVDLNRNLSASHLSAGFSREFVGWLLTYTPRRIPVGFTRNLKRFGYVCRNSHSETCPVCGDPMRKVGFVRSNLPDLPHLIRLVEGGWHEVKPPPPP